MLEQPYEYRRASSSSPTGAGCPASPTSPREQWRSAQWQRVNCVKNIRQLRGVYGDLLDERFYADVEADQAGRATMSMLLPPQMLNTMVPGAVPDDRGDARRPGAPLHAPGRLRPAARPAASHPYATRDSLHEHEMWAVEGLTHRYPTKVLAELLSTCPQYCGHCTRMDLVGNSTPAVAKLKFELKPVDRHEPRCSTTCARTPGVRDVVVSGGDVANLPFQNLEAFVAGLLEIETIRDIRLATKALMGLPQHWLQDDVVEGMNRLATHRPRAAASTSPSTPTSTPPSR